jgi:hypothetical protein
MSVTIAPTPGATDGIQPCSPEHLPSSPETETVTLGIGSRSPFVEADGVQGVPPSPLGHLPTPPAVKEFIAAQGERFAAMTPRVRQRVRDDYNLSYYYGGQEVAFRFTDQGIEVLAVGLPDIEALKRRTTPGEWLGVVEEQVRPWPA